MKLERASFDPGGDDQRRLRELFDLMGHGGVIARAKHKTRDEWLIRWADGTQLAWWVDRTPLTTNTWEYLTPFYTPPLIWFQGFKDDGNGNPITGGIITLSTSQVQYQKWAWAAGTFGLDSALDFYVFALGEWK